MGEGEKLLESNVGKRFTICNSHKIKMPIEQSMSIL